MIWHASWHAVLYEHMAGRSCCFLLGNSNGNVSSHSTEDTHPKTPQYCWGLNAHATSQSLGWENKPFMWCHASNQRRLSLSLRRKQNRKLSLQGLCQGPARYGNSHKEISTQENLKHSKSLALCHQASICLDIIGSIRIYLWASPVA